MILRQCHHAEAGFAHAIDQSVVWGHGPAAGFPYLKVVPAMIKPHGHGVCSHGRLALWRTPSWHLGVLFAAHDTL